MDKLHFLASSVSALQIKCGAGRVVAIVGASRTATGVCTCWIETAKIYTAVVIASENSRGSRS